MSLSTPTIAAITAIVTLLSVPIIATVGVITSYLWTSSPLLYSYLIKRSLSKNVRGKHVLITGIIQKSIFLQMMEEWYSSVLF